MTILRSFGVAWPHLTNVFGKCVLAYALVVFGPSGIAAEFVKGRKSLVIESQVARLVMDVSGGSIGNFQLKGGELNPLHWATPPPGETAIRGFGHFLCLDRWGPPSEAEGAQGMPYHGEAAHVEWTISRDAVEQNGVIEAEMTTVLPKAGFSVRRTIRMSAKAPVFMVREEITNLNPLGRLYNSVQHPTIGPPFLDESTVVDCNGRKGFAQGGNLPTPEEKGRIWDRPLFAYLDAGETTARSYFAFLAKIPSDFAGVESIKVGERRLILRERGGLRRELTIDGEGLVPD